MLNCIKTLRKYIEFNAHQTTVKSITWFLVGVVFIGHFLLPSVAYSNQAVEAKYLQIYLPGQTRVLSLAEVKVFSGGVNIAGTASASQSSLFGNGYAQLGNDGNSEGRYFRGSVTHTQPESSPWWELKFNGLRKVERVEIYNRADCCADRLVPFTVQLLDAQKNIVWGTNVKETRSRYIFKTLKAFERSDFIPANLLMNPTFAQQTNPGYPDYWGVHDAVGRSVPDSFNSYGIANHVDSPIPGVEVLELRNESQDFRHLYLVPFKLQRPLANGSYVFSVYLKSNRSENEVHLLRSWNSRKTTKKKISDHWRKVSVRFNYDRLKPEEIHPLIALPEKGDYYIAAPKLELGTRATAFSDVDFGYKHQDKSLGENYLNENSENFGLDSVIGVSPREPIFEFDYYTDESIAKILFSPLRFMSLQFVEASCKAIDTGSEEKRGEVFVFQLDPKKLELPLSRLPIGNYNCTLEAIDKQNQRQQIAENLRLLKLQKPIFEVKLNNRNRKVYVNDRPFFLAGIAPGGGISLPDWYLREIVDRGITTIFLNLPTEKNGKYDLESIAGFLARVSKLKLKVVIGIPLAGHKPSRWEMKFLSFEKLVENFRENNVILGWFPVDEPAAASWSDTEIVSIYERLKEIDPYRLVFVNWAPDGIPKKIGLEPRGSLNATDVYSIDYYPFQGLGRDLLGFTQTAIGVFNTSILKNKVAHTWLQLYGFMDAWREPKPEELAFMAHLNFIYGSHFSYWGAKPINPKLWVELGEVNRRLADLSSLLYFDESAKQLFSPKLVAGVVYGFWKSGPSHYLLALNTQASTTVLKFDDTVYRDRPAFVNASVYLSGIQVRGQESTIELKMDPYEFLVIKLD